jgi:hypothetical protein
MERGHGLTLLLAIVLVAAYLIIIVAVDPANPWPTTLAYLMIAATLFCVTLASASFLLDRWRVPLLLLLTGWVLTCNAVVPRTHTFEVFPQSVAPVRPAATPRRILTVVAASGGGIQASAWTAQVLTGLQERFGPPFTGSVALISAVSGGSVGTFFFVEAAAREGRFPPSDQVLPAIREAATTSSLEATAWGAAGPDLGRALVPAIVPSTMDRGWALERSWVGTAERMVETTTTPCSSGASVLSQWPLRHSCEQPVVIFNATFVDDGQQALLSNADLSPLACSTTSSSDLCPSPAVDDPTLEGHYDPPLQLRPSTAARLSATFPYVSPVSRAERATLRPYYLADGGYFDNFGTLAALKWLRAHRALVAGADHVVFVQIVSFPKAQPLAIREDAGLARAWLGPFLTILNVRTSSQLDRNNFEMQLYESELAAQTAPGEDASPAFHYLLVQPPLFPGHEAPLSWQLSERNKLALHCQWYHPETQASLEKIAKVFERPSAMSMAVHTWPQECKSLWGTE